MVKIKTFMSFICSTIFMIMLCMLSVSASSGCPEFGDVNQDGTISTIDARLTIRYSVALEDLDDEGIKRADLNKNGKIDVSDARTILRISVKLESLVDHLLETDISGKSVCTICNKSGCDIVGHSIVILNGVEPTCTKTGLTEGSYCSSCNIDIVPQNIIDINPSSHKFELDNSSNVKICEYCNKSECDINGHILNEPKCEEYQKCTVCNFKTDEKLPHKANKQGYCDVCDADLLQEELDYAKAWYLESAQTVIDGANDKIEYCTNLATRLASKYGYSIYSLKKPSEYNSLLYTLEKNINNAQAAAWSSYSQLDKLNYQKLAEQYREQYMIASILLKASEYMEQALNEKNTAEAILDELASEYNRLVNDINEKYER